MTEHTALTWTMFENDDNYSIVGNGPLFYIPKTAPNAKANARFIVTACNCHVDLLEALKRMNRMLTILCKKIDWNATSLDADTIREFNEAPIQAKQAIRKAEESNDRGD